MESEDDEPGRNDVEAAMRTAKRLQSEGRLTPDLQSYLDRLQDDPTAFRARLSALLTG